MGLIASAGPAPYYIAHFPTFGNNSYPVYPAPPNGCAFGPQVLSMGPVVPAQMMHHPMPPPLMPFSGQGQVMEGYMMVRPDAWNAPPPRADLWRPMVPKASS